MRLTLAELRQVVSEALLLESQPRYAGFWKSTDGKWWLDMADNPTPDNEYDDDGEEIDYYGPDGSYEDATTYGPFSSEEAADQFMSDNWANPGSFYTDDSGKQPPPTKSPNGKKVVSPGSYGRGRGYYGFYGSERYVPREPPRAPSPPPAPAKPAPKAAPKALKGDAAEVGDYVWVKHPDGKIVAAKLNSRELGGGFLGVADGESNGRRITRWMIDQGYEAKQGKPAPVAPAGKAAQPPAKSTEKPKGPKTTYKVYNGTGTGKAVTGSSPIHTRIKGKVYAPTGISKFKANDKPSVAVEPDGKSAKVTDGDRSQVWTHREAVEQLIGELTELMND